MWFLESELVSAECDYSCDLCCLTACLAIMQFDSINASFICGQQGCSVVALQESMRMFPVGAFGTARTSKQPLQVGGHWLPANSPCILNFYSMFNSPLYWEQPEVFSPVRLPAMLAFCCMTASCPVSLMLTCGTCSASKSMFLACGPDDGPLTISISSAVSERVGILQKPCYSSITWQRFQDYSGLVLLWYLVTGCKLVQCSHSIVGVPLVSRSSRVC